MDRQVNLFWNISLKIKLFRLLEYLQSSYNACTVKTTWIWIFRQYLLSHCDTGRWHGGNWDGLPAEKYVGLWTVSYFWAPARYWRNVVDKQIPWCCMWHVSLSWVEVLTSLFGINEICCIVQLYSIHFRFIRIPTGHRSSIVKKKYYVISNLSSKNMNLLTRYS